jgi:PAS domain-containing protein
LGLGCRQYIAQGEGRIVVYAKVTRDLTERKNHEEALLANEAALETEKERLQVTLYSIADGVVCTDEAGNLMLMNPAAENMTGWIQNEGHRQTADHEFASIAIVPKEILR